MKSRIIHTKFWTDPYVRNLKHDEKFFYAYLLLNEFINVLHIFEMPLDMVMQQTKLSAKRIQSIKEKLKDDEKIDFVDDYIFLKNAYKYQEYKGIKNNNAKLRIVYEMSTNALAYFKQFISLEVDAISEESKTNNVQDPGFLNLLERVKKRISIKILPDRGMPIPLRNQKPEIKIHKSEIRNQNTEIENEQLILSAGELDELQEKFPKKSVQKEYESAIDWLASSGKKYKDYTAFFRNWLRRSNDTRILPPKMWRPPVDVPDNQENKQILLEGKDVFKIR